MFFVVLFEIYDFESLEMLVLLAIAAVAAASFAADWFVFALEVVGAKFGALEAGFDSRPDLALLLGERSQLGSLLFRLVGVFASAGL